MIMRIFIILYLLLITSVSIKGQTFSISGDLAPCPNISHKYTFAIGQIPPDNTTPIKIRIAISNGQFSDGSTALEKTVMRIGDSFSFNITWDEGDGSLSVFKDNIIFGNPLIVVRNLRGKEFDRYSRPTISGTGEMVRYEIINVGSSWYPSYKHVSSINIPYGKEGNTKIKVQPIVFRNNTKTTEYRWKINGVESSYKGDTYTLSHDKTNHIGTKIIVTAINSCANGLSDSNPIEFTITRNGLSGNEFENITNQTINSNRTIIATNTINVKNSTINNNAQVEMIAGQKIIITPKSTFKEGTKVRLRIRSASLRSSDIDEILTNEEETYNESQELSSNTIYTSYFIDNNEHNIIDRGNELDIKLYPNPTTGIVNIDIPFEVKVSGIDVHNMMGKKIISDTYTENPTEVDLTGHSPGMYLIRIYYEGGSFDHKIMLN